jgi:bifunctional ADP-heptose synthase (sugar kinase/adenylyltransferase)
MAQNIVNAAAAVATALAAQAATDRNDLDALAGATEAVNVAVSVHSLVIARESHLDTNAATSSIRTKLASLDLYVMTNGCNIMKFNGHVKLLTDQLAARGQTTNDLLVFLFKGHGALTWSSRTTSNGRRRTTKKATR